VVDRAVVDVAVDYVADDVAVVDLSVDDVGGRRGRRRCGGGRRG
jgi:hypothetical protein